MLHFKNTVLGLNILTIGNAGNRRLAHADLVGDILQRKRNQILLPAEEKVALKLDDRPGNTQKGLVPLMDAVDEPAGVLDAVVSYNYDEE